MADDDKRQLTLADPVDTDTLAQLAELEDTRLQVGGQMIDCEQEKIKLLAAAHRLDQRRSAVYEKILIDRGVSHTESVEIDAATGKLRLLRPGAEGVPEGGQSDAGDTGASDEDPPPDDAETP